ncbi:methyltransferase domain-containing protein [Kytococcus sp. Marseille-QA3725]
MSFSWDPAQYEAFSDHRTRPFGDLLARVVGMDSSAEMLASARSKVEAQGLADRVDLVEADITGIDLVGLAGGAPDVLVTTSTLHWVPGHDALLGRWLAALAPDGWLAMQVPGNFDAPSHRLLREAAARSDHAAEEAFLDDYSRMLREASPRLPGGGVVLPFRRVFGVARRHG